MEQSMLRVKQAEPDICQAILAGMKRKEIAEKFAISEGTVTEVAKRNGVSLARNSLARMKEKHAEIVDRLKNGTSVAETARLVGFTKHRIYEIAQLYNVSLKGNVKLSDDDKEKIIAGSVDGTSRKELARVFGVAESSIARIVHGAGIDFTYKSIDRSKKAAEMVASKNPGFEYVDGYENYMSYIRVRCLKCGNVFSISYDYACGGKLTCRNCNERMNEHACIVCGKMTAHPQYCCQACGKKYYIVKQRERREADPEYIKRIAEKQAERERKKKQAEELRQARIEQRRHACPVCGEITLRRKYCSDQCANRAENKRRETIRRTKIKNAIVDKDITLKGVWQNSLGICYLCGCVCDWDDKQEKDGTIICGDRYPSIDHIVPLSRGGKHSWNNVALACRKCNSVKSDSIPHRGMLTLNGG